MENNKTFPIRSKYEDKAYKELSRGLGAEQALHVLVITICKQLYTKSVKSLHLKFDLVIFIYTQKALQFLTHVSSSKETWGLLCSLLVLFHWYSTWEMGYHSASMSSVLFSSLICLMSTILG